MTRSAGQPAGSTASCPLGGLKVLWGDFGAGPIIAVLATLLYASPTELLALQFSTGVLNDGNAVNHSESGFHCLAIN